MTTDIHIKHPLRRRGLSQAERIIKALLPGDFRLDERSMQDLITAAYDYARFMRYYTPEGRPYGNWQPFWEVENLTFLAILAALDTPQMRKTYEDLDLRLSEALGAPKTDENDAKVLALYQQLMVTLRDMAAKLEQHYRTLRPEIPIKALMLNRIKRDYKNDPEELERPVQRLIRYHKGADDNLTYRDYEIFFVDNQYNTDDRWGVEDRDFYDQLLTNPDFNREKLRALFLSLYDTFSVVKSQAQRLFDEELKKIQLEETADQQRPMQPHVALFLTFLQLFRYAQESLNEVPKRHLDYYYEQVLGLERRDAVPDHAYLIFTLAKEFSSELLEKDTLLLAGKDKNGQPLHFETVEQWRVTQAKVVELKNAYMGLDRVSAATIVGKEAKPDAAKNGWRPFGNPDSFDIEGENGFALASPHLLMKEGFRVLDILLGGEISPQALEAFKKLEIHFSQKEGWSEKVVCFDLLGTSKPDDALKNAPPVTLAAKNENDLNFTGFYALPSTTQLNVARLRVFLAKDFGAVESFEKKVPGHVNTPWPLVKFIYQKPANIRPGQSDNDFVNIAATAITAIKFDVFAKGISSNLKIQNDFGTFDGTQRIYPFGPVPEKGAQFFIESEEVFQKELDRGLQLRFQWVEDDGAGVNLTTMYANYGKKDPTNTVDHPAPKLRIENLQRGIFSTPFTLDLTSGNNLNSSIGVVAFEDTVLDGVFPQEEEASFESATAFDFGLAGFTSGLPVTGFGDIFKLEPKSDVVLGADFFKLKPFLKNPFFEGRAVSLPEFKIPAYTPDTISGVLRLTLTNDDFWHKDFPNILTVKAKTATDPNALPKQPYTPALNAMLLDYASSHGWDKGIDQFFFITPFGGFETIPVKTDHSGPAIENLLPARADLFYSFKKNVPAGHLFVGLEQFEPGAAISLLFQIAEGTEADPDAEAPPIRWSYLTANNNWIDLPPQQILRDTTYQLTRTGIAQIAVPTDISSEGNTLLNPKLLWLRAAAEEDATVGKSVRALPDILDIRAQAVEATFRPEPGNDFAHLAKPLPAGTVNKLAISRSAVKKVEQPHPSFGGNLPETEGWEFYRRISERLRHRDRAVTIADYERIVLEYTAEVALAKCISHTRYYPQAQASELAPGAVTVAVVPDLLRRPGAVRAEPRFSKGDLEEMRRYLLDKTNLFLAEPDALRVLNPQYEPVRVLVELKFIPGDETLFRYQLNEALRRYLAPWLYDPADGPTFGRILYRSHLIHLIENLDFVEFVKKLEVYQLVGSAQFDSLHLPDEPVNPSGSDAWDGFLVKTEKIQPGTARSILTTIADERKHRVITIEEKGGVPTPPVGLQPRKVLAPPPPTTMPVKAAVKAPAKPPAKKAATKPPAPKPRKK